MPYPATPRLAALCYTMLCCTMLCYAMLCYTMLCYAMLCYAMLCYAMPNYAMLCSLAMLGPAMLRPAILLFSYVAVQGGITVQPKTCVAGLIKYYRFKTLPCAVVPCLARVT